LSHLVWNAYETGPNWMRKIMLVGLTEQPAEKLLPLAHSWGQPAALQLNGSGYASQGFDPAQKAYLVQAAQPGSTLSFTWAASADAPVENPAVVILGWGGQDAKITLNGKSVAEGADLRIGHRQTIAGEDLIVWFRAATQSDLQVVIEAR